MLPDVDSAMLAAGMLAHPDTASDTAAALGWQCPPRARRRQGM
jgi:hypothetical protein